MPTRINGPSFLDHGDFSFLNYVYPVPPRTRVSEPPRPADCGEAEPANWEAAWIDLGGEG